MLRRLIVFSVLFVLPVSLLAWQGNVVGVTDGDTITVLRDSHQQIKVRLWGIDCPEKKQYFGTRAKQFTSSLAFGKAVSVTTVDTDRYGRTVGLVFLPDGQCLNEALLRSGMAWVYQRYCNHPECSKWLELEAAARNKKIGLWSMPSIPPWEFRRK